PCEAERDLPSDPARAARDEDGRALEEAHRRGGSGLEAGAELGISSQPMRVRGSGSPSSAREEAWPTRSRSSIFSSPYRRVELSGGRSLISSSTRARSWYAKCGVADPTSRSISSMV